MKFDNGINLKKEDINILSLRHLYEQYGFVHYKMNKFEEYDLYVSNKDFLSGDNIITFTDTNGRLLALKPDVTLSIVKNYRDTVGTVQKVYYNENIYRPSKSTKTYKELMQMGLECMGDLNLYHISEVLLLAAKSLEALSDRYILDLSHMGVIRGFLEELNLQPRHEERFLSLLREKNCHGIQTLFDSLKIDDELREKAIALASAYGNMDSVLKTLESISLNETMDRAIDELSTVCGVLEEQGFDNVHLDFSIEGDMGYYNGFLFRGYIEGIPTGVLSGGQYDELMEKMGKASGAIGFAINLSLLEDYDTNADSYDTDILLLYDSSASPAALIDAIQELVEQGNTVQAQQGIPEKLRYRRLLEFDGERIKEVIHDIGE
ncbi:MAG: ATP phosphoribosyltransferase regulatory subunit [Firmicutes bacterium]|nr:ATP phosphoribosyltransferase regulatory subunit [Bacillota bacterium]